MDRDLMRDDELDTLLGTATKPLAPIGFEQRLLARMIVATANNVIALPQRKKSSAWFIGLPLAASLGFGIWLGAASLNSNLLPATTNTIISDSGDDGSATGFDDVTQFIEDSLT